jgi:hypothetical protein
MLRKMPIRSIVTTAITILILLFILCKFVMITGVSDSVADFHANISSGNAPLTVQFIDDTFVHRTVWNWDFGDGVTSHAQNPAHTYNKSGNYTVSLIVINNGSKIGTEIKTGYIHVYSPNNTTGSSNNTTGQYSSKSATPVPTHLPTVTIKATPQPTPKASGKTYSFGGIVLSENAIQLILAAAIAVVIAAMIIFFFSYMSKRSGEKRAKKPVVGPPDHPKSPKPAVKSKELKPTPQPPKKSEDISQDYLYGLVMGQAQKDRKQPPAPPQNKKKR